MTVKRYFLNISVKKLFTNTCNMSKDWEENINSFSYKMYKKLRDMGEPHTNIFFGPSGIYTALLMMYMGARGSTADELRKLLELPEHDTDEFHKQYAQMWGKLLVENNGTNGSTLRVANRIWVKKNLSIHESYVAKIAEYYDAGVDSDVDFFNNTNGSREMINKWIEDQTNGKIRNMIKETVLSPATNFLLTSAMYFLGEWKDVFEKQDTKMTPFYASDGEELEVEMMYKKSLMGYEENLEYNCQVCVIPYKNSKLRMVIVCPKATNGLPELEQSLEKDNFSSTMDWIGMQTNREVELYLPKFRIEQHLELADELQALGVSRLFGHADMSRMTRTRDIVVNGVDHAAFIDCNEKGIEVAVVTTSGFVPTSMAVLREVRCDRPFMFIIADKQTESIVFMGRVCRPTYQ